MNATILHESRGRIRFQLRQNQMTLAQADLLEAWLQRRSWCRQVTVHERTCCVILYYDGSSPNRADEIRHFSWQEAERTISLPAHSSRALNREFEEKLVGKVVLQSRLHPLSPIAPAHCPHSLAHDPLCAARTALPAAPPHQGGAAGCPVHFHFRLSKGLRNRRNGHVPLEIGELLEEWTRKKSVADLARCMSLNVDRSGCAQPRAKCWSLCPRSSRGTQ